MRLRLSQRKFSLFELFSYAVTWALVIGVNWANPEDPLAVIAIPALLLPGALIGGPIGLLLRGRKAFIPGAVVGLLVWVSFLMYPTLGAVR